MLAKVHSVTLSGIEPIECEIEVDVFSRGFSGVNIVGLPDAAVKESVDRIKAALINCGYRFPKRHTLVNLAPADVRKEGPAFDLPISIELGRTKMPISDILGLGPGSVVELNKLAGEPVDLLVNNKVVAKGEVVVVDENFGLRITQLMTPEERLKALAQE